MIDLKELMDEKSAAQPSQDHLRLGQVHRKIRQRRRRNLTTLTACAVVLLAFLGGYQFLPTGRATPPAQPAVSTPPSPTGPAEYQQGTRLMAHNVAPLSAKTVSVTWTPTADDTTLELRCHDTDLVDVYVETRLNGTLRDSGYCNSTFFTSSRTWPELRPGEPVTLVVRAVSAMRTDPVTNQRISVPIPAVGVLEVSVKQDVPFEQFPLPPRPAKLKPLRDTYTCQGLRSDPADPRRPVSVSLLWAEAFSFTAESQTPGELELAVNGEHVMTFAYWDYELTPNHTAWDTARANNGGPSFAPPKQGETVTFTVTPRHVSGAWQVKFARYESGQVTPAGLCGPGS